MTRNHSFVCDCCSSYYQDEAGLWTTWRRKYFLLQVLPQRDEGGGIELMKMFVDILPIEVGCTASPRKRCCWRKGAIDGRWAGTGFCRRQPKWDYERKETGRGEVFGKTDQDYPKNGSMVPRKKSNIAESTDSKLNRVRGDESWSKHHLVASADDRMASQYAW